MKDTPAPRRRAPRCKVCNHPARAEIEAAMARGLGKRLTAEKFGTSKDSVFRHWRNCTPDTVKTAHKVQWAAPKADLEKLTLAEADCVLTYLQRLRSDLLVIFESAKADGHYGSIAAISREIREVLTKTAQITGELQASSKKTGVVNIVVSPEYLALRSDLTRVLRRFPEALAAVQAEFSKIEAKAQAVMEPPLAMIEASAVEVPHEPRN